MSTTCTIDVATNDPELDRPAAEQGRPTTFDGILPATRKVLVAFAVLTLLAASQPVSYTHLTLPTILLV